MARMVVTLDGRSEGSAPLVMHNPRLADPLNPWSLEIGKSSRKRGKSEADHLEIAHLEFLGGLYHDGVIAPGNVLPGKIGPYLPTWNVVRSLQNAGKQHKLGATILRGVTPVTMETALQYEGPRDAQKLWASGEFTLRKDVGVGAARTMRTRPIFTDWLLEAEVEVDLRIIDPEKLHQLAQEAGRYQGVGDYRPVYGRFIGSARLVGEAEIVAEAEEATASAGKTAKATA